MDDAGKVSAQRLQDMDEMMLDTDVLASESRQSHDSLLCPRETLSSRDRTARRSLMDASCCAATLRPA